MKNNTPEWLASLKEGSLVHWSDPRRRSVERFLLDPFDLYRYREISDPLDTVQLVGASGSYCEALAIELSPVVRERVTLALVIDYDCGTMVPSDVTRNLSEQVQSCIQRGMLTDGSDAKIQGYAMKTILNSEESTVSIPAGGPDYLDTLDTALSYMDEIKRTRPNDQCIDSLISSLTALREGPKPGQVEVYCESPAPQVVFEHNGSDLQVSSSAPIQALLVDYTWSESDIAVAIPGRNHDRARVTRMDTAIAGEFCGAVSDLAAN